MNTSDLDAGPIDKNGGPVPGPAPVPVIAVVTPDSHRSVLKNLMVMLSATDTVVQAAAEAQDALKNSGEDQALLASFTKLTPEDVRLAAALVTVLSSL